MHFELLLRVPLWWLHCFISSIGRGWDDNLKSYTIFPSCLRFGGHTAAAAAAKSLQLCPTLCDPIDSSPPGSPVPGILQARTQEWVAISFSNAWKWKVKGKSLSRVWLLATPWTTAYQAPPFMGFSRQEYWSGVPLLGGHKPWPNFMWTRMWKVRHISTCSSSQLCTWTP